MYAIIESGSKQYRVETGDQVDLELLESAEDGSVDFDRVLAVGGGDDVEFGTPLLENASVTGRLIQEGRAEKLVVFKMKRRKGYRKKQGHRQSFARVEILNISRG